MSLVSTIRQYDLFCDSLKTPKIYWIYKSHYASWRIVCMVSHVLWFTPEQKHIRILDCYCLIEKSEIIAASKKKKHWFS